ncbi:putative 1,3-beta-glucanosyltransferase [Seiridium cardinale]
MLSLTWLCLTSLIVHMVAALSPISIKGTKLYDVDGNQFFVKGVAYARDTNNLDTLTDTSQCQIDAGLMKTLGINTVRVYFVEGGNDHDGCMQAFATQGIYVWLDLMTPLLAINRVDPDYTIEMYTNWTAKVDAFAKYDNLLAMTVGNEVITEEANTTAAAPYVKAAIRDIKAFRDARGYREIPVAYTADDVQSIRLMQAEYFACGDTSATVDMYGMNVYSWCGNSSYYISGFDKLYEEFESMNIPVLFSETGCKTDGRDFSDVATMLGPVFQAVFSGSVVYQWAMMANGYGIVQYSSDDYTGFPATLDDYNALQTVLSAATPAGTPMAEYTPSNSPPACPTSSESVWLINGDVPLPTAADVNINTVTARTTIASRTTALGGATAGASSTSGTGALGASGATGLSQSTPTASPGLSTAGVAGVAVGSGVGGLAVIGTAIFLFWRRRAARRDQGEKDELNQAPMLPMREDDDDTHRFKSELPANSAAGVIPRQELEAGRGSQGVTEYYGRPDWKQGMSGSEVEGTTAVRPQSRAYEMEGTIPEPRELQ